MWGKKRWNRENAMPKQNNSQKQDIDKTFDHVACSKIDVIASIDAIAMWKLYKKTGLC